MKVLDIDGLNYYDGKIKQTYATKTELNAKAPLASPTLTGTPTAPTPTAGDNSTKLATTAYVQGALSGATPTSIEDTEIEQYWTGVIPEYVAEIAPTGCVQAFAGNTLPQGWLLCDGSAVSRTTYVALFNVIGTTYGAGDGSTTFNLPNLIDKFIEGSATAGTQKAAGLPNITGELTPNDTTSSSVDIDFTGTGAIRATNASRPSGATGTSQWTTWAGFNIDASRSSSIYGNSTTVQPPALTMRYIIKY